MNAVGIIAEYNPFHTGHLAQLRRIRESFPDAPVVVALSGDFVQRGEAATFSKFARAEAAVRCGASLVLELPLPWCLSSAEGFARGGVGLLRAAGVVDCLSFGSESGDGERLAACAAALETEAFKAALHRALEQGRPFAAARESAVHAAAGNDLASVLKTPNDLLAVEYIRAAKRLDYSPTLFPVRREGSAHGGPGSAGELRERMRAGEDWLSELPEEAAAVFRRETAAGRGPVLGEDLRLPLLSRLRERTLEDLAALPDASEGLENRLYRAIQSAVSPEEAAAAAKSRRYALSRLRRMVTCAALGVTADMAEGTPPFLRPLAMDQAGAALLRKMKKTASVPIITKPASARRAGERIEKTFDLGSMAHDLYVLGYADRTGQTAGEDYRTSAFVAGKEENDG